MPADLTELVPDFLEKLERVIEHCSDRGAIMRPYEALRDPWTQAKYWRQSRSSGQVQAKIAELRSRGAVFLADVLDSVGPQSGEPVTNSVPGLSWHQWGEAADSFWLVGDHAVWDTDVIIDGVNGYRLYAEVAEEVGLTAGGHWSSFKDWPHLQLRTQASPASFFTLTEIDAQMRAMWSHVPH